MARTPTSVAIGTSTAPAIPHPRRVLRLRPAVDGAVARSPTRKGTNAHRHAMTTVAKTTAEINAQIIGALAGCACCETGARALALAIIPTRN